MFTSAEKRCPAWARVGTNTESLRERFWSQIPKPGRAQNGHERLQRSDASRVPFPPTPHTLPHPTAPLTCAQCDRPLVPVRYLWTCTVTSISGPQGSSRSFQQLPALVKSLGIRCRPPHLATSQRNTTRRRIRCQPGSRVTRFSITNFPVAFARFACSAASWCMMPTTGQVQSHSSNPFPAFGGRAKAVASSFRPSLKQPPLHLPRPAGITR